MQQQLREREDEIRDLKKQMRGLKEWVSNSTRADATGAATQVSDEEIGAGMARLGNGVQNWVLVNFRRAKVKVEGDNGGVREELGRVVPMFEEILGMGGKIHLIQSVVSRLLVEMVFGAYFVGLTGDQERVVREAEGMLGSIGTFTLNVGILSSHCQATASNPILDRKLTSLACQHRRPSLSTSGAP